MDRDAPAWKLADATLATVHGNLDAVDNAFNDLSPTARDIARAYTLCLTMAPYSETEATRLILQARLRVTLVEEHVAAQRRIGRSLDVLTIVLVVLTAALVLFGGIDLGYKLFADHSSTVHVTAEATAPGGSGGRGSRQ